MIARISRQTFFETFAVHNTEADMQKFMTEQFSEALLEAEVGVAGNIFLLASVGDEVAGYVFLKERNADETDLPQAIEISRIYVLEKFIGQGIGKALLLAAIDKARSLQKDAIWLGVWEHNSRAINFYQSFGFVKFSEHDFILGDDVQRDWLMKLGLWNT
jgi:ribosomal protein S18 acetylase RimI-like enzyme